MAFQVRTHFLQQRLRARTSFAELTEAKAFFAFQLQHAALGPLEVQLVEHVTPREEYLLDHGKISSTAHP
jgi:hypothetical protein